MYHRENTFKVIWNDNLFKDQTNGSRELTQIRTKTTKAYLVSILETRAAPTLNTDSDYLHNL